MLEILMELHVIYKDASGVTTENNYRIGLPQFIKAIGTAGDAEPKMLQVLIQGLGFFAYFWNYWAWHDLWHFAFRRPAIELSDPTQTGQFSNIIGKAIGDHLARRISGAIHTHTYEAALAVKGVVHTGPRPDLYCDTGTKQFTMEAKGFSVNSVSDNAIEDHKRQAQTGPLLVHFAVASVSYNLFNHPECKYYDPILPDAEYDSGLNILLARLKYARLLSSLETFPRIDAIRLGTFSVERYRVPTALDFPVTFLVEKGIHPFVKEGANKIYTIEKYTKDGIFLDTDGVGVQIG